MITFHSSKQRGYEIFRGLAVVLAFLNTLLVLSPVLAAVESRPLVWRSLNVPGAGGRMVAISASPHEPNRILIAGDMLGVGLSLDRGNSWKATTGFKSYEMGDISWHPENPEVVWIGSMSGPYVSRDGGHTWHESREGMGPIASARFSSPIENVLFDPNDHSRLIAIGGNSRLWRYHKPGAVNWGNVWESTDGGSTWSRLCRMTPDGSTTEPNAPQALNITGATFAAGASDRLYAVVWEHGVYVSEDGGRSWRVSNKGLPHPNVRRIVAHSTDPDVAWVSLSSFEPEGDGPCLPGGIYKTRDGGRTWASLNNGLARSPGKSRPTTSRYRAFDVSPTNPQHMVTFDASWQTGVSYVSTNGGETWVPTATRQGVNQPTPAIVKQHPEMQIFDEPAYFSGFGQEAVSFDPTDPQRVYAVGASYATRSDDGGRTWKDITSKLVDPDTPYGPAFAGRGFSGLIPMSIEFHPDKPGVCIVQAMDTGRIWMSVDDLKSWTYHGNDPEPWGGGQDVAFAGRDRIYAVFGQYRFAGVGRSVDGGKTWDVLHGQAYGLPKDNGAGKPLAIAADPDNPMRVWASIDGRLYASVNGGNSWSVVYDNGYVFDVASDPVQPGGLYLATDQGMVYTPDGRSFPPPIGPRAQRAASIATSKNGEVYVAINERHDPGVWRLEKGSWVRVFDQRQAADVGIDPFNPDRLAVTTSDRPYHDHTFATGVWLSSDRGRSWHQANAGLPMSRTTRIAFDPHHRGRLVVGTGGRGFWITQWPPNHDLEKPLIEQADFVADFDGASPRVHLETSTTEGEGWSFEQGLARIDQRKKYGNTATASVELRTAKDFEIAARLNLVVTNYSNGRIDLVAFADAADLGSAWEPSGYSVSVRTEYGPPTYMLELYHGKERLASKNLPMNPSDLPRITLRLRGKAVNGGLQLTGILEGGDAQAMTVKADAPAPRSNAAHHFGYRSIVKSKNQLTAKIDEMAVDLSP